jgi:group I intron endonuclease
MNSGIYQIVNLINNKKYIGSSSNLPRRIARHKYTLKSNQHFNKHLQNSFNKYGKENFEFQILLYCDPENLIMYEQLICDFYKTYENDYGYNCRVFVESNRGVPVSMPPCSEETKQKLALINTGKKLSPETKEKIGKSQKGKKLSMHEVEAIRQRNYGNTYNLGKKRSQETKDKQRESQINKIIKKNYNGHLNEEAVKVIKYMQKYHNYKGLQSKLSELYKISKPSLADIKYERTWSHIKV